MGTYLPFFFSSRRRHTRFDCDWSSDVCSSDLEPPSERLDENVVRVSSRFNFDFANSGLMIDGDIWTIDAKPRPESRIPLSSVLEQDVSVKYSVQESDRKSVV